MSYREDVAASSQGSKMQRKFEETALAFMSLQNFTFIFAVPQRGIFYRL
jgi:hypothetical protein